MTTFNGFGQILQNPTLEDLFGDQQAREINYDAFISQQFPGLAGNFRRFLSSRGPAVERAYMLSALNQPNPALTFDRFLDNRFQGSNARPGLASGGGVTRGRLNAAVNNMTRSDTSNLSTAQMMARQALASQPRLQFNMARDPQLLALPHWLRGSFLDFTDQRFNEIMDANGTDPNFNMLSHLQNQQSRYNPSFSFF